MRFSPLSVMLVSTGLVSGLMALGGVRSMTSFSACRAAEPPTSPQAPTTPAPSTRALTANDSPAREGESYETVPLRGKIVWLGEALERRFGISSVPEARQQMIAIETRDGQLVPIAEDIRGRAFRRDERLRNLADCELLVRRYQNSPVVQVIRLYSHEAGGKFELDYYCDICAITLFELKPCDCCQGPIELRRHPVGAEPR